MKRLLSLLASFGLVASASSAVVSCDEGVDFQDISSNVSYDETSKEVRLNFEFTKFIEMPHDSDYTDFDASKYFIFAGQTFSTEGNVWKDDSRVDLEGIKADYDHKKLSDVGQYNGDNGQTKIEFKFSGYINLNKLANSDVKQVQITFRNKNVKEKYAEKFFLDLPAVINGGDK